MKVDWQVSWNLCHVRFNRGTDRVTNRVYLWPRGGWSWPRVDVKIESVFGGAVLVLQLEEKSVERGDLILTSSLTELLEKGHCRKGSNSDVIHQQIQVNPLTAAHLKRHLPIHTAFVQNIAQLNTAGYITIFSSETTSRFNFRDV